ncbi:hypothetical protein ACFQ1E_05350 [Sphingomonas canadensis]|uniref:STAS/SEC14 domain-containing protein n=1 Tax=Sphingomonas canadensis TaxID=1219257 RepID=A0ABW3H8I0_9SPHN|nr:hypothetical protein [Sphingomonas canadensis]MCW3835786.1 hypothetical protein [Sphingomonas canadensis]
MLPDLTRPPYAIAPDTGTGLVHVKVNALLSRETFDAYAADLRAAARDARARSGYVRMLIDSTSGSILPIGIAQAAAALKDELVGKPGDRVAVIVVSMLQRLQMQHMALGENTMAFLSEAEARAWLAGAAAPDAQDTGPAEDQPYLARAAAR